MIKAEGCYSQTTSVWYRHSFKWKKLATFICLLNAGFVFSAEFLHRWWVPHKRFKFVITLTTCLRTWGRTRPTRGWAFFYFWQQNAYPIQWHWNAHNLTTAIRIGLQNFIRGGSKQDPVVFVTPWLDSSPISVKSSRTFSTQRYSIGSPILSI